MLTDIVLDAMGSDKSPEPELRGAVAACRQFPVRVHLVGPQDTISAALKSHLGSERLPIEVVHASEHIGMHEKAALAVRAKRDSSMRVGLKLVREGKAHGFVTAGNTGAAMATAKMVLGTLEGVDRPALATILPTVVGTPCVLLDAGANVDSDPQNLVQFALMGQIYARNVLGVAKPLRCHHARTPTLAPSRAGGCDTFADTLADQVAFHLGERRMDLQEGTAGRSGRVEGCVERAEADAAAVQFIDQPDQFASAAAKPVKVQNHQHVISTQVIETSLEAGPVGMGTACMILKRTNTARSLESVRLPVKNRPFLPGRDTRVADRRHQHLDASQLR